MTASNFATAAFTDAANTFGSDDVTDLRGVVKMWPEVGRSLIVESEFDVNFGERKYSVNVWK